MGDEETAVHIVLAAEGGGGGFVQLASSTAPLPALHVRPFLALSLESIAIIVLAMTSSISALYAIEASESSRVFVSPALSAHVAFRL